MNITFNDFLSNIIHEPAYLIITILTLGVTFVNGWTDAPNSIATCISTRSLSPRKSIVLAAVFNFLGLLIVSLINKAVATTIYNMVDFGDDSKTALIALSAGLFAIVLWAVSAWAFGIPTSESHSLIAGISGAAIAINGGFSGINGSEWVKVLYGLVISTVLGFSLGFLFSKGIEKICKNMNRRKTLKFFKNGQITGAAFMSFMHGAQDGQTFMGVFLLGTFLASGITGVVNFAIPTWLIILCSAIMTIGTSVGGYKIIKTVGMGMVKLETYQGFAADFAGALCLTLSSLFGIPISTTHTKTTAIMGVGASKRLSSINWKIVKELLLAWALTFPCCGALGFIVTKIVLAIF